jgi:hypothetical protein
MMRMVDEVYISEKAREKKRVCMRDKRRKIEKKREAV